jgi:hypothetical protein
MAQHTSRSNLADWPEIVLRQNDAFGGGSLWIGEHQGDRDILVFDPAESDAHAEVLALYSLTQHRMRRFPRAMARDRIHPITDEAVRARAEKDYLERAGRRDVHQQAVDTAQAESMSRIREGIVLAHKRFIENRGLEYGGVETISPDGRRPRVTRCFACEITLDGFVGVVCGICSGVLCSCGACSCGKPTRERKVTTPRAEPDQESDA